ncbi:MAG: patatin-like phospholipase family protein [Oscillospiraceae bacterium]|jgi:NTE family protein|nr:patatin-like phospholipase family protein [Oscillospiraceae bacterium]
MIQPEDNKPLAQDEIQGVKRRADRPAIGLALGAGAMRGLAHIGVLQVLEREKIPIDVVTGTSIGAIIACAHAARRTGLEMERIVTELQELSYFDLALPRRGMLIGKRAQKLCGQIVRNMTFEEAIKPCAVVACALDTGEEATFDSGPMESAIRASISIPGVFVPHEINGRQYVDGGLVNRVPVTTARELGAKLVIGVDVGYRGEPVQPKGVLGIMMQAFDIMEWHVARLKFSTADIMIVPDVRDLNPAHMNHASQAIARGREAARVALPDIRRLLSAWDEGIGGSSSAAAESEAVPPATNVDKGR